MNREQGEILFDTLTLMSQELSLSARTKARINFMLYKLYASLPPDPDAPRITGVDTNDNI